MYISYLFFLCLAFSRLCTKVPHLGLHAAAATGNIGLAKYALSHGQPINSVIDGVLPLHAACSGGNDMVVRLLIDNGADVNAPRYFFFLGPLIVPSPALISVYHLSDYLVVTLTRPAPPQPP